MRASVLWKIALFVMGLTSGLSLMVPGFLFMAGRPQSQPVELVATTYTEQALCPGDSVDYQLTWYIRRPSILVISVVHLRATGDTVIGARLGESFVTGIPAAKTITDNDARFTVPDLPPGHYERLLMVGTLSEDSKPVFLALPYEIRDDCADGK